MKASLALIPAALLLLSACNRTSAGPFISDDSVRLEIDGSIVFMYDASTCQLSYNRERGEFMAFTDTMLDFVEVRLSEIPDRAGNKTTATVTWSTSSGERSKENITLEVKRIRGDVIWLCDEGRHTAAVVRMLE